MSQNSSTSARLLRDWQNGDAEAADRLIPLVYAELRFISPAGADDIELGPVNASTHKVDEHVPAGRRAGAGGSYRRILELMLLRSGVAPRALPGRDRRRRRTRPAG